MTDRVKPEGAGRHGPPLRREGTPAPSSRLLPGELWRNRREAQGLTIDAATARDLDDALWLTSTGHQVLVQVTISDVAALVPPRSPVDQEALRRVSTRYFSHRTVSMLPRPLVDGRLSLVAGERRPTLTISIPLQADLEAGLPQIERTSLVSRRRLTYAEADELLRDRSGWEGHLLRECAAVAQGLLEKRRSRGALALYDLPRGLATSEEGLVRALRPDEAHLSALIVREFMLLANAAVALYLAERRIPILYRNHTATVMAPEREALVRDLAQAVARPDLFDLERVNQRLRLILNRATYDPTVQGHYGLNLAAYTHITSPIRRYADLVNQRILAAVVTGGAPPYSLKQLRAIAGHITAVEGARKEESSAYWRQQATERARGLAASGRLAGVHPSEMHRAIKVAAREGIMHEALEEAILSALREDKLSINDIYSLLIEMESVSEQTKRIQAEVARWLKDNSHTAMSILAMATQKANWSAPEYDIEMSQDGNRLMFTVVAKIRIGEHEYCSRSIQAYSKKVAQQQAVMDILNEVLQFGMQLPLTNDIEHTNDKKLHRMERHEMREHAGERVNSKGRLQELCQRERWDNPIYRVSLTGLPHQPTFAATVEITIRGEKYSAEIEGEASKKEAEQAAAKKLLERLVDLGVETGEHTQRAAIM